MNELETLCLALGLSTLAGLRLYLTVFLTSLSIHQGWLKLDPGYASLEILGSEAVLVVSGALLLLEFLADKVAGFDSVWDGIHTAVRPIGATLLALQVLGEWPPEAKVIAALCAGGVAFTVHSAKAGTRLLVQGSPEPFSNAALSTAEDVAAAGLFVLLIHEPVLAAVIFLALIGLCLWATPRAWRLLRARAWLLWHRLTRSPRPAAVDLPRHLSADHDLMVSEALGAQAEIVWAMEALSSRPRRHRGLDGNRFGLLLATADQPRAIVFLSRKLFRRVPVRIDLTGSQVTQETTFFSENLTLHHRGTRQRATFRFPRSEAAIVSRLAEELRARAGSIAVPDDSTREAVPAA